MSRWKLKWNSVFFKFSASFILVGLIPLFALSYFSVQTFTGHVERYTENNLRQMIMYMSLNINTAFKEYNETSKLMYRSENDIDQTHQVNVLGQINQIPIEAYLKTVLYSDPNIRSVYFVRSSDKQIYYQGKINQAFLPELLPLEQWMPVLDEEPKQLAIIPTHEETYFMKSQKSVITVGRNLIDTSGLLTHKPRVVGTLFFDIDPALFDQFYKELNLGEHDEIYIINNANQIFFSNTELQAWSETSDDVLVLSEEIPFLQGKVTVKVNKTSLFNQIGTTRDAVYIAIAICSLVLIIMGGWFSRRLAGPIRALTIQMTKVESGNLAANVTVRSNDEMGRLVHGFNRMVERLKSFIDEVYVAEIKQKQAELYALKSQIRPHYLYNTLEVIRMNAIHHDADEVGDMILSLSKQLKYVIDYGEDWVPLHKELQHLQDYFYIIDVRYEQRFELKITSTDNVNMDWQILKLSIQPIVENAIQHGLQPKGRGTVGITIEQQEDQLIVTVFDDGVGMDAETVERLHRALADPAKPTKSVGLKNVHERIRSACGEEYGLAISSRKHVGTSIQLRFPIKEDNYAASDLG
ncbi:sensor histidine kinase [Paenibacillus oenotherae]|uniref:sensor histidine kinase n=1 Tax=Paenibacillus oenotherae TaxID=1435645 RepID=UPI0031BA2D3C